MTYLRSSRNLLANRNMFLKVARHSDQLSVLSKLENNEFHTVAKWKGNELVPLVRLVQQAIEARAQEEKRWILVVDSFGLGGAVCDYLKNLIYRQEIDRGACEVISG